MFLELSIHGLAVMEETRTTWGEGLNAITGATGAGKSLLVRAVQFLLGEKASSDWLREGCREAWVEGLFLLPAGERYRRIRAAVGEVLGGVPEDDLLAVRRVLDAKGRSRSYLNNRYVSRVDLARLTSLLIDVHGQNEHQSLLRPAVQIDLLDAFGHLEEQVAGVRTARATVVAIEREIDALENGLQARHDREDLARYHLQEIEAAHVEVGEVDRLRQVRDALMHGGRMRAAVTDALDRLCDGEMDVQGTLRRLAHEIARWTDLSPQLASVVAGLEQAELAIEEVLPVLQRLASEPVDEETSLDRIEERREAIDRLMRRHRTDEAGLVALAAELRAELHGFETGEERLVEARRDLEVAGTELLETCAQLTMRRRAVADELAREIQGSLQGLGMDAARFSIRVDARRGKGLPWEVVTDKGVDDVAFELAANPGEPGRPLAQVASGGEMARTMLAMKSVLSRVDAYPTLFFDEIDTEVGARLGRVIGERLQRTAVDHQVICITHSPAVAAAADLHFRVSKVVREGRTFTMVERLEDEARELEIAEMIAGDPTAETSRKQARVLIDAAHSARDDVSAAPARTRSGSSSGKKASRARRSP